MKAGVTDVGTDRVTGLPWLWCHLYEAMPHPGAAEFAPSRVTTLPVIAVSVGPATACGAPSARVTFTKQVSVDFNPYLLVTVSLNLIDTAPDPTWGAAKVS